MDQLAKITQQIFDAFEESKPHRAVLVLLDFARAYDRVWRAGLLAKLGRLGVGRRLAPSAAASGPNSWR